MIKLQLKLNPLENHLTERLQEYVPNYTIYDYIVSEDLGNPEIIKKLDILLTNGSVIILLNKQKIEPSTIKITKLKDHDEILLVVVPQAGIEWVTLLIGLGISLALTGISIGLQMLLMKSPKPPFIENESEISDSATYNWDGPSTSYAMGRPVPLIYGKHGTGGTLINALTEGIRFGTDPGWHTATSHGRCQGALKYVSHPVYYGASRAVHRTLTTVPNIIYRSATTENRFRAWTYFFTASHGFDKPSYHGLYISSIYDCPFYEGFDVFTDAAYPNGPKIRPINITKFRIDSNALTCQWTESTRLTMYGWRRWRRYLTYNFSTKEVKILRKNNTNLTPSFTNKHEGWEMDAIWNDGADAFHVASPDIGVSNKAPHFDGTAIDFNIIKSCSTQFATDYQVAEGEGTTIYPEYMYEGIFLSNYIVAGGNGLFAAVKTGEYILHGLPYFNQVELYTFGEAVSTLNEQEEQYYSTANGMRMTIALSDGEVCSIGREKVPVSTETSYEYKNFSAIFLNDIPIEKLYDIPTMAGYGTPIDIDATKGGIYPQIKNAPRDFSNINLLTKRLNEATTFDFLIGNPTDIGGAALTYVTNSICSSVEIALSFKKGLYIYDQPAGEFTEETVNIYIKYKPVGAPESEAKYWTLTGKADTELPFTYTNKKTSPYALTLKLGSEQHLLPASQYEIVISRKDTPDQGPKRWNGFWVEKISEFNYDFLRYPDTALLGIQLLPTDVLQGAQPKFNTIIEGRYIKTPIIKVDNQIVPLELCYTVYDEELDEYSWKYKMDDYDATISSTATINQYTSNPAFIIYDLLTTQELYPYITEDTLVWDDFIYAAEFCWEHVSAQTLNSAVEHRFECNIVLDGTTDAATLLNQLCGMFRFKLNWAGNKLRLIVLKPEIPVQRFTSADILPDTYNETYAETIKIPNTLDISFYDEDNQYKQDTVQVSKKDTEVKKGEIIKQSCSLIGTTKASQAKRISNYLLASFNTEIKVITFQTSFRGLTCIPGNVARVETDTISYTYNGYIRQTSTANSLVYLDKEITIPASRYGTYSLQIQSSITRQMYTVAGGEAPTITFSEDTHTFSCLGCGGTYPFDGGKTLTELPQEGDTWQLIPTTIDNVYAHDYRIEAIKTDVTTGVCTLTCIPYNASVYDESGQWVTYQYVQPGKPQPTTYPADAINLNLTQAEGDEVAINVGYEVPSSTGSILFNNKLVTVTARSACLYVQYNNIEDDDVQSVTCTRGCTTVLTPPCPYGQIDCANCLYTASTSDDASIVFDVEFENAVTNRSTINTTPCELVSSSGVLKGHVTFASNLNITDKTATLVKVYGPHSNISTEFTIEVGDRVIQKTTEQTAPIDHINVYMSYTGAQYTFHGVDNSRGVGYILILPQSSIGKRVWVKVETASKSGVRSLNPPTASIEIGRINCLPPPAHFSLCGKDDGIVNFIGCDIELCWTKVSSTAGAGVGIEEEAGNVQAGAATDYSIVGYSIYVYEDDYATYLYHEEVSNETYKLTHDFNKQLHEGTTTQLEQYGQRALQFKIYQLDNAGNESCDPATLEVENLAPTMASYTPDVSAGDNYINVNWNSFITDPSLFEQDITGYIVVYGITGEAPTYVIFHHPRQYEYKIEGASAGLYDVYLLPMDCFGYGLPVLSYKSNTVQVEVTEPSVAPFYPPDNPKLGFTGDITIDSVLTDDGLYYRIYTYTDLSQFGFEATSTNLYEDQEYHLDHVYYNTNPNATGYCSVTASNLNSVNPNAFKFRLYVVETGQYMLRFYKPLLADLEAYGYTEDDGKPKAGQTFSINAWASLDYSSGSDTVFGVSPSVDTVLHIKWRQPNPDETTDITRLTNYEFDFYDNLTSRYRKTYLKTIIHGENYYENGTYYEDSIGGITSCKQLGITAAVVSSTGHKSATPYTGFWYVNKDALALAGTLPNITWSAVSDTEGQNVQVVITNWETVWQDSRIERFEVVACPARWDFDAEEFIDHADHDLYPEETAASEVLPYEEELHDDGTHTILRAKRDISSWPHKWYMYLGSIDGPIFHWVNTAATNEGGACTNWNTVNNTCLVGCSGFELGDCPYGEATDNTGSIITGCEYSSSESSSRTVDGVNYNQYYVAVAVRLVNGEQVFLKNENEDYIARTEHKLIDQMHISNAAITTAKIKDAAINNAKIRNLSASKVWIGTHDQLWNPFKQQCLYDGGDRCLSHGWIEDETGSYYKTGNCPIGYSSRVPNCNYTESTFALERIFALYGRSPESFPSNEWTYINGGMILTDSIKARSVQVGALPYVADLSVIRVKNTGVNPLQSVTIRWHRPGIMDGTYVNGKIWFAGKTQGIDIVANTRTWPYTPPTGPQQLLPDGVNAPYMKTYVGYVMYLNQSTELGLQFDEISYYTQDWISEYRSLGKLPLFVVQIYHRVYGANNLGTSSSPGNILNSAYEGNFKVDIQMLASGTGTYITNDEITTGILHNEVYTSILDLRHYTGTPVVGDTVPHGTGRLVIDGPSSVYNKSVTSAYKDELGKDWWEHNATLSPIRDTKFLIGRPYVEGLESQYSGWNKATTQEHCDEAYLWFYKTYENSKWRGNLEIGGSLKVKLEAEAFEMLVGKKHTSTTTTEFDPTLNIYDTNYIYELAGYNLVSLGKQDLTIWGSLTSAQLKGVSGYFNSVANQSLSNATVVVDKGGGVGDINSLYAQQRDYSLMVVPPNTAGIFGGTTGSVGIAIQGRQKAEVYPYTNLQNKILAGMTINTRAKYGIKIDSLLAGESPDIGIYIGNNEEGYIGLQIDPPGQPAPINPPGSFVQLRLGSANYATPSETNCARGDMVSTTSDLWWHDGSNWRRLIGGTFGPITICQFPGGDYYKVLQFSETFGTYSESWTGNVTGLIPGYSIPLVLSSMTGFGFNTTSEDLIHFNWGIDPVSYELSMLFTSVIGRPQGVTSGLISVIVLTFAYLEDLNLSSGPFPLTGFG